jgi:hypothetical protein
MWKRAALALLGRGLTAGSTARSEEPLFIGAVERIGLQALGENLPQIWHAATTSAADRMRFVVHEAPSGVIPDGGARSAGTRRPGVGRRGTMPIHEKVMRESE